MLSDPFVATVNGVAKSMPRVMTGDFKSQYTTADGLFVLDIAHSTDKSERTRTKVAITQKKVVTNPLDSTNDYDNVAIQIVIDRPGFGFSATEVDQLWAGLKAALDTSTITKLYGRES